jgi:hypothetical protein
LLVIFMPDDCRLDIERSVSRIIRPPHMRRLGVGGVEQEPPKEESPMQPAVAMEGLPGSQPEVSRWRDSKRYLWLLGLVVPSLPFIAWGLVAASGISAFWFLGPALIFGVFPIIDPLRGVDESNPPESIVRWLEQDRYYRWCTYAFLPLQYAGLVAACWLWSNGGLSTASDVGLALTVAMVCGIAINTAHELGHKRDRLERLLSKIALAQSGYGHFLGSPSNRSRMVGSSVPKPESTIHARSASSRRGFGPTPTAWTTCSGCVGPRGSFARRAAIVGPGSWRTVVMSAKSATSALPR